MTKPKQPNPKKSHFARGKKTLNEVKTPDSTRKFFRKRAFFSLLPTFAGLGTAMYGYTHGGEHSLLYKSGLYFSVGMAALSQANTLTSKQARKIALERALQNSIGRKHIANEIAEKFESENWQRDADIIRKCGQMKLWGRNSVERNFEKRQIINQLTAKPRAPQLFKQELIVLENFRRSGLPENKMSKREETIFLLLNMSKGLLKEYGIEPAKIGELNNLQKEAIIAYFDCPQKDGQVQLNENFKQKSEKFEEKAREVLGYRLYRYFDEMTIATKLVNKVK